MNSSYENNKIYPLAFINEKNGDILLDKKLIYNPDKGISISNIERTTSNNLLEIYKSSNEKNTEYQ